MVLQGYWPTKWVKRFVLIEARARQDDAPPPSCPSPQGEGTPWQSTLSDQSYRLRRGSGARDQNAGGPICDPCDETEKPWAFFGANGCEIAPGFALAKGLFFLSHVGNKVSQDVNGCRALCLLFVIQHYGKAH